MLESETLPHSAGANTAPTRSFDRAAVEAAIHILLVAVGEDPHRDGLRDTPARVARACQQRFAGLHADPGDLVLHFTDQQHDDVVLFQQIPVHSLCERHLAHFRGTAHLGYLPGDDGRSPSPSSVARLVDLCAGRPQTQETLTARIADELLRRTNPRGVLVVLEAVHLCAPMGTRTTSAVRGHFTVDAAARAEARRLLTP